MTAKARTERDRFVFRVKEVGPNSEPLICAEQQDGTTSLLGHDVVFMLEPASTNFHEVEAIANYLNEHIEAIGFTIFEGHPLFGAKPARSNK